MNKTIYFLELLILSLCCRYASCIKCAECRVTPDGVCNHPLGHTPPFTECAKGEVCGTAVMRLTKRSVNPDIEIVMSFGTNEMEVLFKGCVQRNYCNEKKPYELLGTTRIQCHTCEEDGCNLHTKIR